LTSYKHEVFFYGTTAPQDVVAILDLLHKVPATLLGYPAAVTYTELDMTENKVYYVNYDMVQTEIALVSRDDKLDLGLLPAGYIFNEYFGSGLSSIVFQEIREGKALAYSAYSAFTSPLKPNESHYVQAYVGTQSDKLGDAVDALAHLMNNMPEAAEQFDKAKLGALKQIETNRITKTAIYWDWLAAQRRGIDHDIRKDNYAAINTMTMADLKTFFDKHIKGRHYTYLAIGKREAVDMEALSRLGNVRELTLEEVFGY
jgi:predicted Zn-dependent peptidase